MSDELPDPLAMMDQAMRGLTDTARLLGSYKRALVAEGFSPEEALALTIAFQTGMQRGGDQ